MEAGGMQEITRNEAVSVGTSSIIISPVRHTLPKRKVIIVRNISPEALDIITISFGQQAAVTDTGLILKQYESFVDSSSDGYEAYQDQINAICATANGKLAVFER